MLALDPRHVEMIECARAAGAGANYTGSGGAIVAVCRDDEHRPRVQHALRELRCGTLTALSPASFVQEFSGRNGHDRGADLVHQLLVADRHPHVPGETELDAGPQQPPLAGERFADGDVIAADLDEHEARVRRERADAGRPQRRDQPGSRRDRLPAARRQRATRRDSPARPPAPRS